MGVAMAPQACGIMLHGILPAVVHRLFSRRAPPEAAAEEGQEDDYRALVQRKTWRARCVLANTPSSFSICKANWISEPLDHLWHLIQHRDKEGGSFQDLLRPASNHFRLAGSFIFRCLNALEIRKPK